MKPSRNFLLQSELATEQVGIGISRQILGYDENIMLVKVNFESGGIGDIHSHSHAQSTYIVSGIFEITIDEKRQTLTAGEAFFVPPNTPHGAICIESGTLIDAFSPARKDFL